MAEQNTMINLEQVRALAAFACGTEVGPNDKFLSLARSLPAMFQSNGLLASWAFLISKGESHHQRVLKTMLEHFRSAYFGFDIRVGLDYTEVFTQEWLSNNMTGEKLMVLTAEAIIFSGWLKRAAEALCQPEGEGEIA